MRYFALVLGASIILLLIGRSGLLDSNYKNEWQLFKAPEQTVELYFTSHTDLPTKYSPGATSTVTFTVGLHAKSSEYRYEIVQEDGADGTSSVLKDGVLKVSDDQAQTLAIPIEYADKGARTKLIVRLPEQGQSIHYWMERQ